MAVDEKKISIVSREWPLNMLRGFAEILEDLLREDMIGRVWDISFIIDPERGRAIVDLVGEVCDGQIAIRFFSGQLAGGLQQSANDWISEEKLDEIKARIARSEGQVYLLLVGRLNGF